ncbi:hypothetical protein ABTN08_19550, partial [Acinetobacter baumannii]
TLKLAEGDLTVDLPPATGREEVGEIIRAVQVFKENMIRSRQLEQDAEAAERRAEQEKRQAMTALADQFENRVGSIVTLVSSAAADLEGA